MERRRESRITTDEAVRVTLLNGPETQMDASIADISGRGMRLICPAPIAPGCAIKALSDDVLLLGEVCYCKPEGSSFSVGVLLDQVLRGLRELTQFNRSLVDGGGRRVTAPETPVATRV